MGHKERKRTNQAVPFGFSIRKGKGIRRWFSHSLILSQAFLLPPLFFFYVFLFFFLFSLVFACSFIVPLTGELHGRQWGLYMIMLPFFIVFFSHSISPLFSFSVPLLRHHCGPFLRRCHRRCSHGSLASRRHAPVALGRCNVLGS